MTALRRFRRSDHIPHVDSVVVAQEPRLKDHREAMRERLAQTLGLEIGEVSVKLKSAEGLGALGGALYHWLSKEPHGDVTGKA